jgi:hypothetical protein
MSAQAQLFHRVILDANELSSEYLHVEDPALKSATAAFHRLASVLENSPHLIRCIRYLAVLARPELLALVSGIQLPQLQKIHLNFGDTSIVDDDVTRAVQYFTRLPSIRGVHLSGLSSGIDFAHFEYLFDGCGSELDTLVITESYVHRDDTISSRPPCSPPSPRPLIKTFKMYDARVQEDWFLAPSCPLDFTRLVRLDAIVFYPLDGLLSSLRSTLTRLRIDKSIVVFIVSHLPHG